MRSLRSLLAPRHVAHAHCGLPCGIYDPDQARVEAESCLKIDEKYAASQDPVFRARALDIKEQRASLCQHHLDVLWHDYFKPDMLDKVPNLHQLFWEATKQVQKVKESVDPADAQKLLGLIDQVDQAWRATGGAEKTRVRQAAAAAR